MMLTITTTHRPATDLGYLLAKHPERCQSFDLAFGRAHVVYAQASDERCSASLILDLDPIGLVRSNRGGRGASRELAHYVNDRPYVCSSFLAVAIAQVYGSALHGRSAGRQELAARAIPLEADLPVVQCRGDATLIERLFAPLGYAVRVERHPLDARFPQWGESAYHAVRLRATVRLADLLGHLYVLLPVLDDAKHYWVGEDELEKLLEHGAGWLDAHPERDLIARRYLKHRRELAREAIARLRAEESPVPDEDDEADAREEARLEARVSLAEQRLGAVLGVLDEVGARTVLDVGCGEGRLLARLVAQPRFERITGVDVSPRALEIAADRLRLERMPERRRARIALVQGALTYRDARFAGHDAICAVEVVEHIDPPRLAAFERTIFEWPQAPTVIVTTPNREHNVLFEGLPEGALRHRDHRFEWTRAEFAAWAGGVAARNGYAVRHLPIGNVDPDHGAPTQMAIFSRAGEAQGAAA